MARATPENTPLIVIPVDYVAGPAMQKLNERQQAFVLAMLEYGGLDNTKAAVAAGYTGSAIRVHATRLAHDEKVLEAIREESYRRLRSATIMATNVLLDIANDVAAEKKDRLKAVEMIYNRCGLPAVMEQKISVVHKDETTEGMLKRAEILAKKMGMDPQKLMGTVLNGDYKDVTPPEAGNPATEIPEDDLSDIL